MSVRIIYQPGLAVNGSKFLIDEDEKVREFKNHEEARSFLTNNDIASDQIDGEDPDFKITEI